MHQTEMPRTCIKPRCRQHKSNRYVENLFKPGWREHVSNRDAENNITNKSLPFDKQSKHKALWYTIRCR